MARRPFLTCANSICHTELRYVWYREWLYAYHAWRVCTYQQILLHPQAVYGSVHDAGKTPW